MRTKLIAALLLLISTPALAEADWVEVSKSEDGFVTSYVDRSWIRITGPNRRYWGRTDYVNDSKGWKKTVVLREDNCASGQHRMLQFAIYMVDGTNSGATLEAREQSWEYVTPDTMDAAMHAYVCRKLPQRRIR